MLCNRSSVCVIQGSAATLFRGGGRVYTFRMWIFSGFCKLKIIKIGSLCRVIRNIKGAEFLRQCVVSLRCASLTTPSVVYLRKLQPKPVLLLILPTTEECDLYIATQNNLNAKIIRGALKYCCFFQYVLKKHVFH